SGRGDRWRRCRPPGCSLRRGGSCSSTGAAGRSAGHGAREDITEPEGPDTMPYRASVRYMARRSAPVTGSRLPESLRWDAERPVETRGRVLPRDDHRQLRDRVVVVVPSHPREQLVADVAAGLGHRVGVFERHLLRVAEERAVRVVVERLDLLGRDAVPAAHGSIDVLSELAAVPP